MTDHFWNLPKAALLARLEGSPDGLSEEEASRRIAAEKGHRLRARKRHPMLRLLAAQFRSPITMLLVAGAACSLLLGDVVEGLLILLIVLAGGMLGFWQERRAAGTIERLLGLLQVRVDVLRGGKRVPIDLDSVVPGDVVVLEAGSAVPGDALLLESKDLFVDEAALTGESFPAEKKPGTVAANAGPHERSNALFMGTHVISGTARALVAAVGTETVFGALSAEVSRQPPETSIEKGLRHFGYLLLEIALALALIIFAVNVAFHRPVLESLLFTLALAVGLTPQLLPAIQGVTLARGAARMADRQVVVRRLSAIEDIGAMNLLCTDKTGTLTEGVASLQSATDAWGEAGGRLRLFAYLNASLQSGYVNPIDDMLRQLPVVGADAYRKSDEVPYDFSRKRLSVVVEKDGHRILITKGALDRVKEACAFAEKAGGERRPMSEAEGPLAARGEALSRDGYRCLGVACRELGADESADIESERDMVFLGIIAFSDPLKDGAREGLAELQALGVAVKVVTGDNRFVAAKVAGDVGLNPKALLTGAHMRRLSAPALAGLAPRMDVFAEMDPNQKERVIDALRQAGYSVGYLGDGINDAAALHRADAGISVDTAVDATRQAADIVLLRKDLGVLAEGVREGRRAFGNTLKYVFITTSANFGNMISMAGASLFASFLPMLPRQILLLNVLSDLPALAIASDRLDPEMTARPRRWNLREIQRFMLVFGLISSVFDFLTFGILLLLRVPAAQFRTAWFVESLVSELLILLVIRTRRWSFRSRPGKGLLYASLAVTLIAFTLPYLPLDAFTGFRPLSAKLLAILFAVLIAYVLVSEFAKRRFYRFRRSVNSSIAKKAEGWTTWPENSGQRRFSEGKSIE